jgi:tetratricopeptide (TPR) repeat protein
MSVTESAAPAALASALSRAIDAHRAGNLDEAGRLYRRVLTQDGRNFDALHMLGVLEAQRGNFAAAEQQLRAALQIDGKFPPCIHNYANTLVRLKRYDEALIYYDKAVALAPHHPPLHSDRGNLLSELGRLPEALASYDAALKLAPTYAEAHCNRGSVLHRLNRHLEAIASFDQALQIDPNHVTAHLNRGNSLCELRRFAEALACYRKVSTLQPQHAAAHQRAGRVLHELKHFSDALASYGKALVCDPNNAELHCDRAAALDMLGEFEQALLACDRAIALDPALGRAHQMRGICLNALDRQEEAVAAFDRALAENNGSAEATTAKALCLLALGRLGEGWDLLEHRFDAKANAGRRYPQPRWEGDRLDGTLLVWGEQGLGDQILYASMVPELSEKAREVVLEVEPRLVPLFARSFPGTHVVAQTPELHAGTIDAQISLTSLGGHLRRDRGAFPPREQGYLKADEARSRALRERLAPDGRRLIGLSWISVNAEVGRRKSAALREVAAMLRLPDCRFIDLQYGDTAAERAQLERELGIRVERLPDIDNTQDIDGLAALVAACDAVVTVSNTTAHLAGALGRPTWVLVPAGQARLWYWFKDGDASPWYPRVRLHRHKTGQSWADVAQVVASDIQRSMQKGGHPS